MGAYLSLPVVGYLLMPSVTSYSTSLNLLFFYMVPTPTNLTPPTQPSLPFHTLQ